jgi:hypothetical protein
MDRDYIFPLEPFHPNVPFGNRAGNMLVVYKGNIHMESLLEPLAECFT